MGGEPQSVEELEFNALRNALYHTARRQRLELWSRMTNFAVIVGGASAVVDVARDSDAGVWIGLAIAIIGASQLVFDFSGRARTHELLQKQYYSIMSSLKEQDSPDRIFRAKMEGEMLRIAGEEPPTYRALDAIAYNEACDALHGLEGQKHRLKVRWWQSITAHLIHHNNVSF